MGTRQHIIAGGVTFINSQTGSRPVGDMSLIYSGSGNDSGSFVFSGSQGAKLYFSGSTSGKMGIGTTNPTNDVDIKTDTLKSVLKMEQKKLNLVMKDS